MEGEKINGEIISLVSELHKKIRLLKNGVIHFWLKALGRNGNLKSFDDVYSYFKKDVLKSFLICLIGIRKSMSFGIKKIKIGGIIKKLI